MIDAPSLFLPTVPASHRKQTRTFPEEFPASPPESPAEEKNGGPAQGETDGLWPYRTRGEPQATDSRPSTPDIPKEILKIHTGIPILP